MEAIWKQVQTALKTLIPAHSYRMWIEPIDFCQIENDKFILSCPNFFSKKRIQDHYFTLIKSQLMQLTGKEYQVDLIINENRIKHHNTEIEIHQQLSLPNMNPQPTGGRHLRKDFTFDRFVVCENNQFAYSAALAMASEKQSRQRAMYLLSRTGMGKSHLSQAIGHYIQSKYPTESVYYITADDFTNEMVQAFRTDSLNQFKEKYRKQCDVLILEDVHFLTGKDRTQIELALSLDYLMDSEKKIIFTSCYKPSEIPKMNEQLISRLSCGLIPHIDPPDFQTRVRILQEKLKADQLTVPMNVLEYLASKLTDNIRQLESGLLGVTAKSSLLGTPVDIHLAESVVKNIVSKNKTISVDVIKELICKHYNISVEDIVSRSRKNSIAQPRHLAIYLSRRYTNLSLQAIGKCFNRYHATAIRSISTIERGIKEDTKLKRQVEFFCDKLDSGDF